MINYDEQVMLEITRLSNSLTSSHVVLCCPLASTSGTGRPSMATCVQMWLNEAKNALVPSTKSDFFFKKIFHQHAVTQTYQGDEWISLYVSNSKIS